MIKQLITIVFGKNLLKKWQIKVTYIVLIKTITVVR